MTTFIDAAPAAHTAPPSGELAIDARGLVKRFGDTLAVDGVDLAVPIGSVYGVLGPNGAGKTTTVSMLATLLRPDGGEGKVFGYDVVRDAVAVRSLVGVTGQYASVDEDLTASQNLMLFARLLGKSRAAARNRTEELLNDFGLAEAANRPLKQFSGGMRRRLDLAASLIDTPPLLFLDEPTTGLDPQARHLIWDRLKQLKAAGKTLILTTHFMDEAERLCDTLIVIDHGRKITEGSPRELIAEHIEPQVIEVFDELRGQLAPFVEAHRSLAERVETSGETAFFYCRAPQPLLAKLAEVDGLRYVHRASNLEDVFIKLTGRELRD